MFQELIDAINRLRNAVIEAEKRKHAHFAAGAIAGALAGGVSIGNLPDVTWEDLDGFNSAALDNWADDLENCTFAYPEGN